jgi:hypothetical protein
MYNWAVYQPEEYGYITTEYGRCARIQCASTSGHSMLMTPSLSLNGDYSLSFKYVSSSANEKLKVVVVYDGGADTLGTLGNTEHVWETARYDLSSYKGKVVKLGFYATASKASSAYIIIDDVRVLCYVDNIVFEDAIAGINSAKGAGIGKIIGVASIEPISFYEEIGGLHSIIKNFNEFDKSILEMPTRF